MHLHVISRQLQLLTRRLLAPHDLTPEQFNILRILRGSKGQPMAVQALSARMVHPSSNASRLIDKLEGKRLVHRTQCPDDRRRAEVTITPSGLELLTCLDPIIAPTLEQALVEVPLETTATLNDTLAGLLNGCDTLIEKLNNPKTQHP
jgi:DNA-binding MarR family transcriptional regulator